MVDRKPHAAIGLGLVCLAAALLLVADDTHGKDAPQGLPAVTIRRVHPVLIRNERNALLEVVVDVKRNDEVLLRSLTFGLGGTEKLGDLESLELFSTGNKREFVGGTAFGTAAAPAARISFTGNQALQPGANVFWLSCRLKPTASLSRKVGAVCTSIGTTAANRETFRKTLTSGSVAAPMEASRGNRPESSWTWVNMAACRRSKMAVATRDSLSTRRLEKSFALQSGCGASLASINGAKTDLNRVTKSARAPNSCWFVRRTTGAPGRNPRT